MTNADWLECKLKLASGYASAPDFAAAETDTDTQALIDWLALPGSLGWFESYVRNFRYAAPSLPENIIKAQYVQLVMAEASERGRL